MARIIAHCRKVPTTVGLHNVAAHNCREGIYDAAGAASGTVPEWISHPERAKLNEGDRTMTGQKVLQRREERITTANLVRKPQTNAASAIEVNLTASAEWFDSHSKPDEWKAYLRDCREFIEGRYGKENVLHWAAHYDEKSPHLHVLFVPIMETEKGLKYSSSEFLGGRDGLRKLQDEIAAQVGAKYGLERGVEGSDARHTNQYEWAAETAALRTRLIAKEKELTRREAEIARKEARLEKLASARIPPFTPKIAKKQVLSPLMIYTLSDGREVNGYEAYATGETALQAAGYTTKVGEIAQAAQAKAAKYEEAATKTLPAVHAKLAEVVQDRDSIVERFKRLTPEALRSLAAEREMANIEAIERRKRDGLGYEL